MGTSPALTRLVPPLAALSVALVVTAGCGHAGRSASALATAAGTDWTRVSEVRLRAQNHRRDCGAAALDMVLGRWSIPAPARSAAALEAASGFEAGQLRDQARALGLEAFVFPGEPADLLFEIDHGRPVILGLARREGERALAHFVVATGHNRAGTRFLVADPDQGWRILEQSELEQAWSATGRVTLVIHPRDLPPGQGGPAT